MGLMPRYPLYIPSRGRPDSLTAKFLDEDGVPFRICAAPFEADAYRKRWGDRVLELPSDDMDIVAVRNWMRDHSESLDPPARRHWQLDDNIRKFYRRFKARRFYCASGLALAILEDFTDRYTNVALSAPNYAMFCPDGEKFPAVVPNSKCFSCVLVNNEIPYRWRGPYNDDMDMVLQCLAGGWVTLQFNTFLQDKLQTMLLKGGMTDANENNYQGDGRLRMARGLENRWPGVVRVMRRFNRPQHYVMHDWRHFDTPLKLREDLSLEELAKQGEGYEIELRELQPVKSERLRRIVEEHNKA